jgi:hypothetical protein
LFEKKIMDKGGGVDIVIEISSFNENIQNAVFSVLLNKENVKALHIVESTGAGEKRIYYPTWESDLQKLREEHKLEVLFHIHKLDESKLRSHCACFMQGDMMVTPGVFETLFKNMQQYKQHDHFTVTSILMVLSEPWSWRLLLSAHFFSAWFWYGYLLVLAAYDKFRYCLALGDYNRTMDLRASKIVTSFPNVRRLASNWWWWRIPCFTNRSWVVYSEGCQQYVDTPADQGMQLVMRTIQSHRGFGLFSLPIFFIYWLLFAFPFWMPFLYYFNVDMTPYGFWVWIFVWRASWFWALMYVGNMIFVSYVSWSYVSLPFRIVMPVQIVLTSLYLMTFPIILFIGRLYVSRSSWSAAITPPDKKLK